MRPLRSLSLVGLLLVALFIVPAGSAQDHEHGGANDGILLISDVPEDGRTVVGEVTHFSYVVLDDDGAPAPHNDVHVSVVLNGQPIYETESAHDYDGVGGLDIVFPVPGDYNVTVTVPGDTERVAHYSGYVVTPTDPVTAALRIDAPERATAGDLVPFTIEVVDDTGTIIPHTDALVEIRRLADDFPVLALHTHTHNDPMAFEYAFEKAGPYLVRTIGYTAFPSEGAPSFKPVLDNRFIVIDGEATPSAAPGPRLPGTADSVAAETNGFRTEIAADPVSGTSMRVGPFSQVRTSLVIYNETAGALVQHTNHEATLTGPYGTVFRSDSLHEYDGVLEIMSANQMVGTYTWRMDAARGDWSTTRSLVYDVLPANAPAFGAGPQFLDVNGLDRLIAGTAGTVDLFVHGPGDVPFQHGELTIRLDDDEGLPLVAHKLHTHATGTFAFRYTPPVTGAYTLQVDPFDIHGAPTPTYHGETLGATRALAFSVTSGDALVGTPEVQIDDTISETTPGVAGSLLGIVCFALAGLGRRLRPAS